MNLRTLLQTHLRKSVRTHPPVWRLRHEVGGGALPTTIIGVFKGIRKGVRKSIRKGVRKGAA